MKRIVLAGLALTLLAAACGGGDDEGSGTTAPTTAATTAPTPSGGDPVAGETAFQGTCSTCHGTDATGIEGLGKSLIANEFVGGLDDAGMLDFLKVGRPTSDPLNTTGVDMPPKGGNPALTDDDLLDVIAYLRTL